MRTACSACGALPHRHSKPPPPRVDMLTLLAAAPISTQLLRAISAQFMGLFRHNDLQIPLKPCVEVAGVPAIAWEPIYQDFDGSKLDGVLGPLLSEVRKPPCANAIGCSTLTRPCGLVPNRKRRCVPGTLQAGVLRLDGTNTGVKTALQEHHLLWHRGSRSFFRLLRLHNCVLRTDRPLRWRITSCEHLTFGSPCRFLV